MGRETRRRGVPIGHGIRIVEPGTMAPMTMRYLALPGRVGPAARPAIAAGLAVLAIAPLFVLAATDHATTAALWENLHWTLSALAAAAIALLGVPGTTGRTRQVRILTSVALALYLGGTIAWDVELWLGVFPVPAPSDALYLGSAIPIAAALLLQATGALSRAEVTALALDGSVVVLAVATVVLSVYEPLATGARTDLAAILLAYPIVFLGVSAFAIMAGVTTDRITASGPFVMALGLAVNGIAWVVWIAAALDAAPPAGTLLNALSSVATIIVGYGGATWTVREEQDREPRRAALVARAGLPILAALFAVAFLGSAGDPSDGWSLREGAAWAVIVLVIARQTLLLRERTTFLRSERRLRDGAERALAAESASERRYRSVVSVFARLGEHLTFAAGEDQMLAAGAGAIRALLPDLAGEIQLLNPSQDRLVVALGWGDGARAPGERPAVDSPLACFGLRRSASYVTSDVGDEFAVGCPAFPAPTGAVACIPMISNGQPVGVIHLRRGVPFDGDDLDHARRTAEQLALAIANARLLRTMENLALTDPLTGLYNKRFFDPYAERELAAASRDGESVGLVMIDLDHFKAFNDRYGHPAGDEALRTFARVAQSVIRRSDTLARYGGEEFVLLVRDADVATTEDLADKLRTAIAGTIVDLGLGSSGRITASFGVANSAIHGPDRLKLVRAADRALYSAKQAGRDRVRRAAA